jgi:ribosome-associated protein
LERISRTQKKKNAERLQKLGERLIDLDDAVLDAVGISEELREAVMQARGIKQHEARRRQLQYIGRLMREVNADPSEIQSAIERAEGSDGAEKRKFKQVETWRNELLAGNRSRFDWLLKNYPRADPADLRRLISNAGAAKKRAASGKRAAKALFRYLRALID